MVVHRGPYLQKGRGFGSMFASLFKSAVPALKLLGTRILGSSITKSIGKTLAHSALQGGLNIAADTLSGRKKLKDSFSHNVGEAKKDMAKTLRAEAVIRKGSLKRKDPPVKTKVAVRRGKKKKHKPSVFEDDEASTDSE
jgi:hypothetical protein